MKFPRRQFLHLAAGAAALPVLPHIARAQAYPTRPITMIVPFAAGGPTDVAGRIVAERMRASLDSLSSSKMLAERMEVSGSVAPLAPSLTAIRSTLAFWTLMC